VFRELVLANRSYRRFREDERIEMETLRSLVDLARCTPSAANLQPLKYILSNTPERNAVVFSTLAWAGYLPDWPGPVEGERPSAYVIVLLDTCLSKSAGCDLGIAAQTILLGATEKGLGGCMFGSIERDRLCKELAIDERFDVMLVIALGKPVEKVVLEDVGPDGSIKYYRDDDAVHHVPKRKLGDVILP
jgi:nitroreductase